MEAVVPREPPSPAWQPCRVWDQIEDGGFRAPSSCSRDLTCVDFLNPEYEGQLEYWGPKGHWVWHWQMAGSFINHGDSKRQW